VAARSLPGRGITKPADLVGNRLRRAPGTIVKIRFPSFVGLAGLDPRRVTGLPDVQPTVSADGVGPVVSAYAEFELIVSLTVPADPANVPAPIAGVAW
jgi:NitT/TauT family transport system substrate-binding protein